MRKLLWWILLEDSDTNGTRLRLGDIEERHSFLRLDKSNLILPPRDPTFTPVGHIALTRVCADGQVKGDSQTDQMLGTLFPMAS